MDTKRRVIMLVDDNAVNLSAGKNLLKEKYDVFTIPSAEGLFKLLGKVTPDLILLDIEMPDMNGFEAIKVLKQETATANIPVIFLTSSTDTKTETEGLNLGAADFVTKPFSQHNLISRIENILH
jgi:putative two-component system response regulator